MQNQTEHPASMRRRFPIILLLSFASVALVAPVPAAAPLPHVSPDVEARHVTIDRELELFRTTELSLRQAMAVAEKLRKGGRIVDISFDGETTSPVYRVTTLENDQVWKDEIDANTGDIRGNGIVSLLKDLDTEDRNNLGALSAVRQELSDAVVVAERSTLGRAVSGGLMSEGGKLKFVVTVLSGDDLKQVILEPPQGRHQGSASRPRR